MKKYLIAHDIRSAWNVGSFFRTADAAGFDKIFLTGYTATPDHPKVAKTSLNAEDFVAWEKQKQAWRVVKQLKKEGVKIIALEQTPDAQNIFKLKKPISPPTGGFALIVGNEIRGVPKGLLKYADIKTAIPMYGRKESLNVAVAFGVAAYILS
ncbi:MAG: RNA methyltransferase [Candidatus Yanofskybacteria bacterium CG10_big_fil_rev_8_21_14_0_10_46_23]|uniref:RNA methyltransferase n=1 Tax=Candidatus Yanofskybacteria bacterium CG10_big_fil_rev_8_21_14_0_10_46_23 TaxID=1975098 RepID=A0A2H0R3P4_9BACT|nr:MAG: RNA methyltransferase [Candidatus Yanofskybacteria bacterium CG10_big_fil_rev_8_21_14_0_10_46_23]